MPQTNLSQETVHLITQNVHLIMMVSTFPLIYVHVHAFENACLGNGVLRRMLIFVFHCHIFALCDTVLQTKFNSCSLSENVGKTGKTAQN